MTTSADQTTDAAAPDGAPESSPGGVPPAPPGGSTTDEPADDCKPATFDREYVEEAAQGERRSPSQGEARRHPRRRPRVTSYAERTWKLAEASDLTHSADLCDERAVPVEAKVWAAVDALHEREPHFASRRPAGDVGHVARAREPDGVSLAGLLLAEAG